MNSSWMKSTVCMFGVVLLVSSMCFVTGQDLSPRAKDPFEFEATRALDKALAALDNNEWRIKESKYKLRVAPKDDDWIVIVTFLPEAPGNYAVVVVDKDGETSVTGGF